MAISLKTNRQRGFNPHPSFWPLSEEEFYYINSLPADKVTIERRRLVKNSLARMKTKNKGLTLDSVDVECGPVQSSIDFDGGLQ